MDARTLLLMNHACTHSKAMYGEGWWKEEDSVCGGLTEEQLRVCPEGRFNSIAWLLWHIARCEDVAVNSVLRGTPEVLDHASWLRCLTVTTRHIGTGATMEEVRAFSQQVDLAALRAYRAAVGQTTRAWVSNLNFDDLDLNVLSDGVQRAQERGAFGEQANWLAAYWAESDWSRGRFLSFLALEHNWFHIGEMWNTRSLLGAPGN